jgi:hypothetical protein
MLSSLSNVFDVAITQIRPSHAIAFDARDNDLSYSVSKSALGRFRLGMTSSN